MAHRRKAANALKETRAELELLEQQEKEAYLLKHGKGKVMKETSDGLFSMFSQDDDDDDDGQSDGFFNDTGEYEHTNSTANTKHNNKKQNEKGQTNPSSPPGEEPVSKYTSEMFTTFIEEGRKQANETMRRKTTAKIQQIAAAHREDRVSAYCQVDKQEQEELIARRQRSFDSEETQHLSYEDEEAVHLAGLLKNTDRINRIFHDHKHFSPSKEKFKNQKREENNSRMMISSQQQQQRKSHPSMTASTRGALLFTPDENECTTSNNEQFNINESFAAFKHSISNTYNLSKTSENNLGLGLSSSPSSNNNININKTEEGDDEDEFLLFERVATAPPTFFEEENDVVGKEGSALSTASTKSPSLLHHQSPSVAAVSVETSSLQLLPQGVPTSHNRRSTAPGINYNEQETTDNSNNQNSKEQAQLRNILLGGDEDDEDEDVTGSKNSRRESLMSKDRAARIENNNTRANSLLGSRDGGGGLRQAKALQSAAAVALEQKKRIVRWRNADEEALYRDPDTQLKIRGFEGMPTDEVGFDSAVNALTNEARVVQKEGRRQRWWAQQKQNALEKEFRDRVINAVQKGEKTKNESLANRSALESLFPGALTEAEISTLSFMEGRARWAVSSDERKDWNDLMMTATTSAAEVGIF